MPKNDSSFIPPVAGYLGPFGFDFQNPTVKFNYFTEGSPTQRQKKSKSFTLHAVRCANLRLIFNNPSLKELFTEFDDYDNVNDCFAYFGLNVATLYRDVLAGMTLADKIVMYKEGVNNA